METQTPWTVDGFVGTPDIIDNEGNDYFQFNPSTPRYSVASHNPGQFPQHSYTHPGHPMGFPNQEYDLQSHNQFALHHPQSQATFDGFQSDNFQLENGNELRNVESHSSLRSSSGSTSHRSNSSVSSHYTWSTTTHDEVSSSDVDPDDSTSLATSISPSLIGGQVQTQMVEDNKRQHGRIPSLSIDPKLFRPATTASSKRDSGSDNEIEMLETAKPKSRSNLRSSLDKKTELLGESPLQAASAKKGKGKKERAKKTSSSSGGGPMSGGGGEGKKVSHARKQTADHIPRPRNAFILFRKHVVDSKLIPASVEMRHQNVSIITAKMWSEAPPDQKAHFNELAKIEKEEHMKKYPGYRYQPVYRRTNVIRRRVRKDEAEEQKCKSVAELLIKGKSGEDLENEIKEKIRNGNDVVNNERNDKSSSEVVAKDKSISNSRRSSAACELSKGALRALRAQARQQSSQESGDWSDISSIRGSGSARGQSRSNSRSLSRTQSYAFEFEDNCDSDDGLEHDITQNQNQGQDQMLGYGLAPSQIQGFAQQHQQLGHDETGSGSGSWGDTSYMNGFEFGQPQPQGYGSYPQSAFTADQSSTCVEFQPQPQTSFSDPSSSASQNFLYPQPQHGNIPLQIQLPQNINRSNDNIDSNNNNNNEFYAYDTALPFSPSAAITNFSFPYPHSQEINRNNDDIDYFNMNMDMDINGIHKNDNSEGIYEFTLPSNPNSTSIGTHNPPPTYLFNNGDIDKLQTSQNQIHQNQNQIDHNHHNHSLSILPPSSGVPLENLPFDDHLILGDFEAALAHADESNVEGVW